MVRGKLRESLGIVQEHAFFTGALGSVDGKDSLAFLLLVKLGQVFSVKIVFVSDQFFNKPFNTLKTDPLEGRFLIFCVSLLDKPYRLEHVRYIIEPPNLGLQLLLFDVPVGDPDCSLLETDCSLPGDKETDELLTEQAQALLFFLCWRFFVSRAIPAQLLGADVGNVSSRVLF